MGVCGWCYRCISSIASGVNACRNQLFNQRVRDSSTSVAVLTTRAEHLCSNVCVFWLKAMVLCMDLLASYLNVTRYCLLGLGWCATQFQFSLFSRRDGEMVR
jgi:hypothetical protein